ncbi:hypothetical protein IAI18_04135 [Acetobacteraceae bacterium H6797]|nr:hypothetical protein [Acetobacteraceae bacterium H6797]
MDEESKKAPSAESGSGMANPTGKRGRKVAPDAAFDLWLQRGLHAMYDGVAQEPVPEEWLNLIAASMPNAERKD